VIDALSVATMGLAGPRSTAGVALLGFALFLPVDPPTLPPVFGGGGRWASVVEPAPVRVLVVAPSFETRARAFAVSSDFEVETVRRLSFRLPTLRFDVLAPQRLTLRIDADD
jgi:hypothetical protein